MSLRRYITPSREQREQAKNARMRSMLDAVRLAPKPSIVMGGTTTGADPKSPADHLQAFRDLAMGEACVVGLREVCRRDPLYTVLAHTNTQTDEKGMGYKGHDSAGVFACDRCHEAIDRRLLPPVVLEEVIAAAQQRMTLRLRFLAGSITERPWRVRAAAWGLKQRQDREQRRA